MVLLPGCYSAVAHFFSLGGLTGAAAAKAAAGKTLEVTAGTFGAGAMTYGIIDARVRGPGPPTRHPATPQYLQHV